MLLVLDNVGMTGRKTSPQGNWINRFKNLAHTSPKLFKLAKFSAITLTLGVFISLAIGQIVVRYWVWPELHNKKPQIEQLASQALGVTVTIGDIQTSWTNLRPAFEISELSFKSNSETQSKATNLEVPKISAILGWDTIWKLTPSFYSLKIDKANIKVIRDISGQWIVAGIPVELEDPTFSGTKWLFDQSDLQVSNVGVDVLDLHDKTSSYQFKIDKFETKNFQYKHQINLALKSIWTPEAISFQSQFTHRPFSNQGNWQNWNGKATWNVDQFNLAKFLSTTHLPIKALSGTFNTKGDVDLNNGKFSDGEITFDGQNLDIYWEKPKNTLRLKNLNGVFKPSTENDLQYLQIKNLNWQSPTEAVAHKINNLNDISFGWGIPGDSKSIGTFSVLSQSLSLEVVHDLLTQLPIPATYQKQLAELKPQGQLENLYLIWHQPPTDTPPLKVISYDNPQLVLSAQLKNVGWNYSSLKIPGFKGLNGQLITELEKGSFKLESKNAILEKGEIISRSLTKIDEASADISWFKKNNQWHIDAKNIVLNNPDILINGDINYSTGHEKTPSNLKLDLSIPRAKMGELAGYLPKTIDSELLNYLSGTLVAGDIKNARLNIHGDPEKIPYTPKSASKFELIAPIENGAFRPAPKNSREPGEWLAIEKIKGTVKINNTELFIDIPQAGYREAKLTDIKANADFSKDIAILDLTGNIEGVSQDIVQYITATPLIAMFRDTAKDIKITGNTKAAIKLNFPFSNKIPTRFVSDINIDNNQVRFGEIPAGHIRSGKLTINENGIEQADIVGEWLGGPLVIKNDPNIKRTISFNGKADFAKIGQFALTKNDPTSMEIKKRLHGLVNYQGKLIGQEKKSSIDIEFDLKNAAIDLPKPLSKPMGVYMPGKANITSNNTNKNEFGFEWNLTLGDRLQSKGLSKNGKIEKQGISLGTLSAVLPASGTGIVFDVDTLQGDDWGAILSAESPTKKVDKNIPAPETNKQSTGVTSIKGKAKHLIITDRDFADFSVSATHEFDTWIANVDSPLVTGQFKWQSASLGLPSGELTAKLSKLIIPQEESSNALTQGLQKSSNRIPKLDIAADQFVIGKRNFGSLSIQATGQQETWNLDNLKIKNPNGELNAKGIWKMPNASDPGQTNLTVDINSPQLGKLLTSLGNAKVIEDGQGKLEGNISWQGAPYAFDKKTLSGDLAFTATKGTLLQVDPGAAKLLGLLSFQSLFKLATFNIGGGLGDAVSEGTYFEKISATANLRRGIARTEDFEMLSNLAKINMRGRANLNDETQDLRVTVYPKISLASTSLAAFYFVSPIVGLSTLVGQFLISSSMNKILQADYLIQGSWQDPEVIPLDQNGKPLNKETLDKIRRKSLLENPTKPTAPIAPNTPIE